MRGDILLFQPGQREIKEARDYINTKYYQFKCNCNTIL